MQRSLILLLPLLLLALTSACRTARSQTPESPLPSCNRISGAPETNNALDLCLDNGILTCSDAHEETSAGVVTAQDCTLERRTTVVPAEPGTAFGVLLWATEAMDVGVVLKVQGQDLSYEPERTFDFGLIHVDRVRSVARVLTSESRPGRTQFLIYVDGQLLTTLTFLLPATEATPIERTP